MGCGSCSKTVNGVPQGCGSKGHCTSGSCNKKNTFDWLSDIDLYDPSAFKMVEVSFKQGSRKDFFLNNILNSQTGDMVVVETGAGYDVGRISLSGELVRTQLKKKNVSEDRVANSVIRVANQRDLEKLDEARAMEKNTMVRARVISRTLGLDMKLGDVEYQGDKRKATFFYTAEGRVDFRELVRTYAKEFRVKIEMRQIGARQESARIGGIGSCGRELCCSTWLSDFKSVSTGAARYQNIAINQTKLSGQCGRLKCCLNYELDTYMDALKDFPKSADFLRTAKGKAALIKKDIFKGMMFYSYLLERGRGPIVALDKDRVKEILAMNKNGEKPADLLDQEALYEEQMKKAEVNDFGSDVDGVIELPELKKKKRNNRNKSKNRGKGPTRNDRGPKAKSKGGSNGPNPRGPKPKGPQARGPKAKGPQAKGNPTKGNQNGPKSEGQAQKNLSAKAKNPNQKPGENKGNSKEGNKDQKPQGKSRNNRNRNRNRNNNKNKEGGKSSEGQENKGKTES